MKTHSRDSTILVGCAGWNVPAAESSRFCDQGSHLERYSAVLGATEINSTFHRHHRPATYARWSATVPPGFRFSVKMSKEVTHRLRLVETESLVATFVEEVSALGEKLSCFLVQLPPSLEFNARVVRPFFVHMKGLTTVPIACEPRHPSWFEAGANDLLGELLVARVAADPAKVPAAGSPGGSDRLTYYRLHGTPRLYYSEYTASFLEALASRLREAARRGGDVWCIFDNTTLGAAATNALDLRERLMPTEVGILRAPEPS